MSTKSRARLGGVFTVECRDAKGNLKWFEVADNIVPNGGLQDILDAYFPAGAGAGPTNLYVGLTDGTPTVAAGDTMASHAGWTEVTAYSEGTREAYTDVRSSQTVSNSASKASFSISSNGQTIGGAFLTDNSTKGGSTGVLVAVAAFTGGDKSADSGDTLNVQYDFTAADDGA